MTEFASASVIGPKGPQFKTWRRQKWKKGNYGNIYFLSSLQFSVFTCNWPRDASH
jgi:hypothetical protein